MFAIQQPSAAFKLCLLYSSLWLPSSFVWSTGCLQDLFSQQAAFKLACYYIVFGCLLAIQQPLCALKLCLLYSSLWLPSSSAWHTAAFVCLQALLDIQQPLAAFKLGLPYSSLWQPSSSVCHTAAFGCLQALLDILQPLTAFTLCLLFSSLWLLSSFICSTSCLQTLLNIH